MAENYFKEFCDKSNKMTLKELKSFCLFYFNKIELSFNGIDDSNIEFLFKLFSHHDQINLNQFIELFETINIMKKEKNEFFTKSQSPKKREKHVHVSDKF